MSESVVYLGRDLESMSFAVNYHKWILDEFRPFLGKHLVEVGAGTGSFSELLCQESVKLVFLVEPSKMFAYLQSNIAQLKIKPAVYFYQAIFSDVAEKIVRQQRPDSIIYVNVLEHIEDDLAELQTIYDALDDGGRCFIFVPALMSLYGELDRRIGHFRRYKKAEIEDKCRSVGFNIEKSKYFDFAGILPWYVKVRLLKSANIEPKAVALYDQWAVPITKKIESLINIPLGKNLLLIGKK